MTVPVLSTFFKNMINRALLAREQKLPIVRLIFFVFLIIVSGLYYMVQKPNLVHVKLGQWFEANYEPQDTQNQKLDIAALDYSAPPAPPGHFSLSVEDESSIEVENFPPQ